MRQVEHFALPPQGCAIGRCARRAASSTDSPVAHSIVTLSGRDRSVGTCSLNEFTGFCRSPVETYTSIIATTKGGEPLWDAFRPAPVIPPARGGLKAVCGASEGLL